MTVHMHVSMAELEREIRRQVNNQVDLRIEGRKQVDEIKDFAVSISPIASGEYAGSWHVQRKERTVRGMPAWRITNDSPIAEIVEYGTGPAAKHKPRRQGGSSPEWATAAKTAERFGGTQDGIEI